jgi:hypothetical protein
LQHSILSEIPESLYRTPDIDKARAMQSMQDLIIN